MKRYPFTESILAVAIASGLGVYAQAADFYAYYTKLDYTQPQSDPALAQIPVSAAEVFSGRQEKVEARNPKPGEIRWGKYADLVVNVAEGRRFVFSRATGYLPFLQTPEGKFPIEQAAGCQPDPLCLCSYVRLVESEPGRIVVHWRHVPDPASVVMTETIQEYFTFTPDGKVRREITIGTTELGDFHPGNVRIEELSLAADGITVLSQNKSSSEKPGPAASGSPVRATGAGSPAAWLKFDDGLRAHGNQTDEDVSDTRCPVAGNIPLWKKGVSGTALAFDGYFSKVTLPKAKTPTIKDEITLEAWVALGAYPWSDAGIVHCSAGEPIGPEEYKHGYQDPYTYRPWRMEGYMLGVDPYGRPIFKINGEQVGGGVLEPADRPRKQDMLPTYRWTHLTASYGKGRMCLYVDGELAAEKTATGPVTVPDRDVLIGLNGDPQRISDPVSHSKRAANNNLPLLYGIEGLIDEVKIYDRALSPDEIAKAFQDGCPPAEDMVKPDLEPRILPGMVDGKPAEKFGAVCRTLKYHDLWDNLWRPDKYRDILVRFDTVPGSVVFWQGTNFGSGWVTENNKWMSDQSWEIGGPHGCAEHMADKRGRFDHVRLIENTAARVVVHWRYASIDVGYVFPGTAVWADEYYTIYPDGTGVRYVEGIEGGWHDTQFLSQAGTTCLDTIELTALSVANMAGESRDLTWELPNRVPDNPLKDACIKRLNFKSRCKVFAIYREGAEINQWGEKEQSKHTSDPFAGPWNHWPVGLNPSDGRYAVSNDRVTHAAIGGADPTGNLILYGFTDQPATGLIPLAKSWNRPPTIDNTAGCESKGYEPSQRAYMLTATSMPISFTLNGTRDTPIHHPCFVVEHWDSDTAAQVTINGKAIKSGKGFRQGIVRDTQGRRSMIVWLDIESTTAVAVGIREESSKPD